MKIGCNLDCLEHESKKSKWRQKVLGELEGEL